MSTKLELFRLLNKDNRHGVEGTHDIALPSIMAGKEIKDAKPDKFLIDAHRLSDDQRAEAVAELRKLYVESGDKDRNGLPIDPNVIGIVAPKDGRGKPIPAIYVPIDFPDRLTEMQAAKAIGVIRFTEITNQLQSKVVFEARLHRMRTGKLPEQREINRTYRKERLREPTITGRG